jgi:8-oxo-dGTP pyrophosphatase MutT (NUDIX family)
MKKERHNSRRRSISSRQTNGKEKPRIEVSAGGLVLKKTRRGLLFAMVKDSYGKWTFPKGHVRRGESFQDAAAREVEEEVGLSNLRFVRKLDTIDIWFRDRYVYKGKLIHKFIHFFLFTAHPRARLRKPEIKETGEKIRGVAWVSAQEVMKRSNYKDMKPIIKKALDYLNT